MGCHRECQYKDAKTLFEAIQARCGGNDATKKTQRTLLKQMYEYFNAPSTESLDSIFNSLLAEWNTHVVVWRNKADLDTMSFDDLYNNFRIVEQEVKRMVTTSSSSGSQNMAFLSSPGSTNEIDTANIQVSTVNAPDCTSMSSVEAEYVSLSECCAQVLWMRTQLTDYGFHFDKIPMYCDSKAAIAISCNPVQHSRTKHINVRYHFIKDKFEKGIIELFFVGTEYQLANLFTKALPVERFKYLVKQLGMRCLTSAELEALANESA
nr:retrovirus-related Pol polyprotein from transposon TNT 1-94 [Tanacetum cinerariifolium]